MDDFTLVCGVDKRHLEQLHLTFPTWICHKPSLLKRPMLIFYDREQVSSADIRIDHPNLELYPWPPKGIEYRGGASSKWTDPQRFKMLAGFVHVSAIRVQTRYMLKLDTDAVATGQDDWLDDSWFEREVGYSIISHRWGFTKPPDQIIKLDQWVRMNADLLHELHREPALNLAPEPKADKLRHPRIISWCAFFEMDFIRFCAAAAMKTCGPYQLPVPSQDGFVWYCAARMRRPILRANMKALGWQQWMTMTNIRKYVKESLFK